MTGATPTPPPLVELHGYREASLDPLLLRQIIREAVPETIAVPDGGDLERCRARMTTLADEGSVPCLRSHRPGHFTGSAAVVDPSTDRTLVLFHRKLRRWLQPGGHADGDTNLAHVAWREASEETGIAGLRVFGPAIDLDIHEVAPPGEDPHLHFDVRFLILCPPGAQPDPNHESNGVRWLHGSELATTDLDPSARRLLETALRVAAVT